jgi:hypothetical protein
MTQWLIDRGLTRDSAVWLWGRLAAGAALVSSGLVPLDAYVGPSWAKALTVAAVLVLWLSGKYDSSPLPGKRDE